MNIFEFHLRLQWKIESDQMNVDSLWKKIRWWWCDASSSLFWFVCVHAIKSESIFCLFHSILLWWLQIENKKKRKYNMTYAWRNEWIEFRNDRINEWMNELFDTTWLYGCGYARMREFCAKLCEVKSQCRSKKKTNIASFFRLVLQISAWQ